MNLLTDDYAKMGTEYNEFCNELNYIAEHTKTERPYSDDATFLSPVSSVEDGMWVAVLNEDILSDELTKLNEDPLNEELIKKQIPKRILKSASVDETLHKEMWTSKRPAILLGNKFFFVGETAMPTLSTFSRVTGDATINSGNIFRDKHLSYSFIQRKEITTLVYRELEEEGLAPQRKIIAVMSRSYKYVPQTILKDIINEFVKDGAVGGMFTVREWCITQAVTRIHIEFPEIAKDFAETYKLPAEIMPGLILQTSDTGASSLTVRGTYRMGRSYIVTDEILMRHSEGNSVEKLALRAEKEIFSNFRKLPEVLIDAIGTELNYKKTVQLVTDIVKGPVASAIGNKAADALAEDLTVEINPEARYTLYDVSTLFMDLPERISGISDSTKEKLRGICSKIPFELKSRLKGKSEPEPESEPELKAEDFILLPA